MANIVSLFSVFRYFLLSFAGLFLSLVFALQANASVVLVDTDQDTLSIDGSCSLREAVYSVNNQSAYDTCSWSSTQDTFTVDGVSYSGDIIEFDPALNGNTITLSLGSSGEDVAVEGDLDIQQNVLVRGNGVTNTTINGGGIDRVFQVFSAPVAAFESLTIEGGSASKGAGVYAYGLVGFEDVMVSQNTGDGVHVAGTYAYFNNSSVGGNTNNAIYNEAGSSVKIEQTYMRNNGRHAVENFGNLTVRDSFIELNYNGIYSDTAGTVRLYGTDIAFNGTYGIYENNASATLELDSTQVRFSGSIGVSTYGSLYVSNGSEIIDNVGYGIHLFPGNSVLEVDNSLIARNMYRGVYSESDGSLRFTYSTIDNNYGSGLDHFGSAPLYFENMSITNQTMGPGIYNSKADLEIYSSNISYNRNSTGYAAGVQSMYGTIVTIEDSSFIGNYAGIQGGALYLTDATVNIYNSSFLSNTAGYGGAIFLENSQATLEDVDIEENVAFKQGGGIYALEIGGYQSVLHILDGSSVDSNTVTAASPYSANGGGIYAYGEVLIADSTVNGNSVSGTSDASGGGIYALEDLFIRNSEVSENTAFYKGGGVYLYPGTSFLSIGNDFLNNEVTSTEAADGGAIYAYDAPATIYSSSFTGNKATRYGGAILSAYQDLFIEDASFISNRAQDGGAVSVRNGANLDILQSQFSANAAYGYGGHGGAVSLFAVQQSNIVDSSFSSNTAFSGGALYEQDASLEVLNSTFNNNIATNGGAMYLNYPALLDQVTISGNVANSGAGVEYVGRSGTLLIDASTIAYNIGTGLNLSGTVDIARTVVSDNSAYACRTTGTINSLGYNLTDTGGCSFTRNTDTQNQAARLYALTDNGGPTLTHLPRSNSPLVDASFCVASVRPYDQRGKNRVVGSNCDIGAVERQN